MGGGTSCWYKTLCKLDIRQQRGCSIRILVNWRALTAEMNVLVLFLYMERDSK